jgi:plasmid stability protein
MSESIEEKSLEDDERQILFESLVHELGITMEEVIASGKKLEFENDYLFARDNVSQDFVENVLWKDDDSYQMESFVEYYYDTDDFDYMKEGKFFIRRDYEPSKKEYRIQTIIEGEEKTTIDLFPPNMYCCLIVNRYTKRNTEPKFCSYEVAMLHHDESSYYAVKRMSYRPVSKIYAFLFHKLPDIYEKIKNSLTEDEKNLISKTKFFIPRLTEEVKNLNGELWF